MGEPCFNRQQIKRKEEERKKEKMIKKKNEIQLRYFAIERSLLQSSSGTSITLC